ncbi:DUF5926 family protein [Actinokineospora pegani]|uniref:DUF5926 family protein n=1 Tax=Actinokineospora pegani TaxID=2654637 RepID=UPI0012EA8D1A|nr:DUF5926 family protein [Actinokineospora pegani]
MSRRSAEKNQRKADDNPRRPCPCGSGKRYKACHGLAGGVVELPVNRPFEGMALECELIAMREFVPSGTAKLPGTDLVLATVLPMAAAALVRADGVKYVGLQVQTRSSDVSRDLARAVLWARDAEPGDVLAVVSPEFDAGDKPERLQDLVDTAAALEVEVHDDFTWWMPEGSEPSGEVALSLERANNAILPTERIGEAAYWVDAGEKAHLRWVRPEPEDDLLAALARLHAAGELGLGEGTRYAGSFRAHGLLVPVWDLDREMHAREWAEPAAELGKRLETALASVGETPLTPAERRSRDGLLNRQKTL